MCTAANYQSNNHYFGRTFDWNFSYGEKITITPRNFTFNFQHLKTIDKHFAIIGMAVVDGNYPMYFDATNEKGLSMAGLNFPENAVYLPVKDGKDNITVSELIPFILCECETVKDAREKLRNANVINFQPNPQYPLAPLHWIISDKNESLTVEPTTDGLKIYDNPVGVLTNNPPFDYHMYNLANYINLTPMDPNNNFSDKIELNIFCKGMGSIGLPGDPSSASRFIKAAFCSLNSVKYDNEDDSVGQFFHILGQVEQIEGCVQANEKTFEKTLYTSCCNTDKCIYYYKTYSNSQINGVNMYNSDIDGNELVSYELVRKQNFNFAN